MLLESSHGPVWGALFTALLVAGCVADVRWRRIPNALVLTIATAGLCYSLATRPFWQGLGSSVAGLLLGFVIWIVFYVAGVLGAGDVKFFAAAGAWLGPAATWRAALVAGVAGGVLAVFYLVRERRLASTVRRMALATSSRTPALLGEMPDTAGSTRRHLPYGVALALGAATAAWVPHLLG
jgi:prepilin peptidase CpaA